MERGESAGLRGVGVAPLSDCRTGVATPPRPPRSTFSPLPARAPPGEPRSGDSAALRLTKGEASGEPRGVVMAPSSNRTQCAMR
jgi:hypothetical protein